MAPKKKGPRPPPNPSKLTEEREKTIVEAIRAGTPVETAAELAGISPRTLWDWLQRGSGEGRLPSAPCYVRLSQAVARAKAEAERDALDQIRQGVGPTALPDWKARDRWLQITRPERYGDSAAVRAKVESELADVVERLRKRLDSETFRRVAEALAAGEDDRGGGSPA